MRTRSRLVVVSGALLIACVFIWKTWHRQPQPVPFATPTVAESPFTAQTIKVGNQEIELKPIPLGIARSTPDTEFGPKIAAALEALKQGGGRAAPDIPPLDPESIPEHLLPKAPNLSAAQRANLARLQWGLTKDLRYLRVAACGRAILLR